MSFQQDVFQNDAFQIYANIPFAFQVCAFQDNAFQVDACNLTVPPEEHHGGGYDYGEHKRKHREKEELLEESKKLITKIRTDDNPQALFAEAESVTSQIKREIERLGLKAAYFERLHNEQQAAKALSDQEQLQAQMEEIDVVYMTFLMIAHLD